MNDLHFANPLALWLLGVLPFFIALLLRAESRRREALDQLIAARLQPRLAGSVSVARRRWNFALLLAGIAMTLVALARPQIGFTWEEKRQSGRDIIIAIDTSNSMLATDLQPNRLTRAVLAAEDLLNQLDGDRVGLLAFAGSSFLQAPLTSDFGAVRETLKELDTDIIPRGGTNLADAIKAADDAFGKGESEHRALIIFSDGEELEANASSAARDVRERFQIYTVGMGMPEGALIPVRAERSGGTEFLRDAQGQYVKTKLDEGRLREVAEAGGGFYVALRTGPAEMQQIFRDGLGKMKAHETDARFARQPIERYQWPLGAGLAFLVASMLIGERKRIRVMKAAAAGLLLAALPAQARHAGIEKFDAKDYAGSLGAFESELKNRDTAELHFNAGAAAYQLGEYAKAAEAFSRALGTAPAELKDRAAYNLGNTFAQRGARQEKRDVKVGDFKDAIAQYDQVLKSRPTDANAKHNRNLVAKLVEELEKEEQKDEEQKQDPEKKDQEKKDESKKDSEEQKDSQTGKDDKGQEKQPDASKEDQGKESKENSKEQGSKDGEKKDAGNKDGMQQDKDEKRDGAGGDQKDPQQQKPDDKQGEQKQPAPNEPGDEKEKSGEVKAANPGDPEPGKEDPAAEAAEAAQAAKEDRMTEKDAAQILEALKRVDRRVRLIDPKDEPQKNPNAPYKNW